MKKLIALTLALVLFFSTNALSFRTAAVNNYSVDTPYTYPVVPGTDAWAELQTRVDMAEACMIPEELLSEMTTSALLETVLNYPLLADIMAFNSAEQGVERVASSFNGLQELLLRSDLQAAMNSFSLEDSYIADETEAYKMVIAKMALSILKRLGQGSSQVNSRSGQTTTLMTPTGDHVTAIMNRSWYDFEPFCFNPSDYDTEERIFAELNAIEEAYETQYNATRYCLNTYPHNASCNCHCFALYGEGQLEPYWIDDPRYYYFGSAYFGVANGKPASLYQVPESNTLYPHIVLYYDPELTPYNDAYYTHTAIRTSADSYYSKWGFKGVFRHSKERNPYYVVDSENETNRNQMAVSYWRWDYDAIED